MPAFALDDGVIGLRFARFLIHTLERDMYTQNYPFRIVLKETVAIQKVADHILKITRLSCFEIKCTDFCHNIFYFCTKCARISTHSSPNGARDTCKFLPAAKTALC